QQPPAAPRQPKSVPVPAEVKQQPALQAQPALVAKKNFHDISTLYTGDPEWAPAMALPAAVLPTNYAVLDLLDEPERISTPEPSSEPDKSGESKSTKPLALKRPLQAITIDASLGYDVIKRRKGAKSEEQIENFAEDRYGDWTSPSWDVTCVAPRFCSRDVVWAAPAVFHRPLYFEQPNVERYGHYVSCGLGGDCVQSAICAAHFFASVPLLPCRLGSQPCMDHEYVLGCYRPGSCNPHQLVRPKCTLRGVALQGLYTTGVVFFVP
ncbi:MAG: hypothetical protein KC492_03630, partial [Myxococcales bacterium]|nr:hypothetical protein [Myxococcales bacterium]